MPPDTDDPKTRGPIDDVAWPAELLAHVVTPGPSPRLHGYDVEADLARHYRLAEVAVLALTGELLETTKARAVDAALIFLAPTSVADAPPHAAVLCRLCGAESSALIGVTAIALAEQARALVAAHADWLAWLAGGAATLPPAEFLAETEAERDSTSRLRLAAGAGAEAPWWACDPKPEAAALAILVAAGLHQAVQLETLLVQARLPAAIAEGIAWKARAFDAYAMDLPHFSYGDPR